MPASADSIAVNDGCADLLTFHASFGDLMLTRQ
jgi:hypothetical protein